MIELLPIAVTIEGETRLVLGFEYNSSRRRRKKKCGEEASTAEEEQ